MSAANPVNPLTVSYSQRYIKNVSVIDLVTLPRVPGSVIDVDDLSTREADATFAELICADPQWLEEEFTALVSASFGAPPRWPRPPAPPRVPFRGLPAWWPAAPWRPARPTARTIRSPGQGLRRTRAPPAARSRRAA